MTGIEEDAGRDGHDDGRNGGSMLGHAKWWLAGAGILLLLPRQWVAAGAALLIAGALALVHRWRRTVSPGSSPEGASRPPPP